ncbi:hypothetical protein Hanom_Chr00s000003g01601771 [Helianthus anomalus]
MMDPVVHHNNFPNAHRRSSYQIYPPSPLLADFDTVEMRIELPNADVAVQDTHKVADDMGMSSESVAPNTVAEATSNRAPEA